MVSCVVGVTCLRQCLSGQRPKEDGTSLVPFLVTRTVRGWYEDGTRMVSCVVGVTCRSGQRPQGGRGLRTWPTLRGGEGQPPPRGGADSGALHEVHATEIRFFAPPERPPLLSGLRPAQAGAGRLGNGSLRLVARGPWRWGLGAAQPRRLGFKAAPLPGSCMWPRRHGGAGRGAFLVRVAPLLGPAAGPAARGSRLAPVATATRSGRRRGTHVRRNIRNLINSATRCPGLSGRELTSTPGLSGRELTSTPELGGDSAGAGAGSGGVVGRKGGSGCSVCAACVHENLAPSPEHAGGAAPAAPSFGRAPRGGARFAGCRQAHFVTWRPTKIRCFRGLEI